MKSVIVWFVVVCTVAASDDYHGERGRYKEKGYQKRYVYYGRYGGKCHEDGLYYRDDASFVICTNGNDYIQPCAPGTKNKQFNDYSYGGQYDAIDFCSINLVDQGYGAKRRHYGKPVAIKTTVRGYDEKREYEEGYTERGRGDYHKRDGGYHDDGYHADGYHDRKHVGGYHDDRKHVGGYRDDRKHGGGYRDDRKHGGGYRDDRKHGGGYRDDSYHADRYHDSYHGDRKPASYDHGYGGHQTYDRRDYHDAPHGFKPRPSYHDRDDGYHAPSHRDGYGGYPSKKPGYEYVPKYEVESYSKGYAEKDYGYDKGYKPHPRH